MKQILITFLILVNVGLIVSLNATRKSTNIEQVQRRFNLLKKKLERQQAKKAFAHRQFTFRNKTLTTPEYDPILKKPTQSPITRGHRLIGSNSKLFSRNLNELRNYPNDTNRVVKYKKNIDKVCE